MGVEREMEPRYLVQVMPSKPAQMAGLLWNLTTALESHVLSDDEFILLMEEVASLEKTLFRRWQQGRR